MSRIGEQFIKELREKMASESKAYKWHRKAQAKLSYTTTICVRPMRLSKAFVLERYLNE